MKYRAEGHLHIGGDTQPQTISFNSLMCILQSMGERTEPVAPPQDKFYPVDSTSLVETNIYACGGNLSFF